MSKRKEVKMKRKLRFVCTMLICVVLFSSELFRINVFAEDLANEQEENTEEYKPENVSELEEIIKKPEDTEKSEVDENKEEFPKTPEENEEEGSETPEENEEERSEIPEENEEEGSKIPEENENEEEDSKTPEGDEKEEVLPPISEEVENEEVLLKADEDLEGEKEPVEEEKENDDNQTVEEETVTLCFASQYGSGSYKTLEEGSEWKCADGFANFVLTKDSAVTVQIKADEGCFIVSDCDEDYCEEMQIELSWDNKEEFQDKIIKFERKVAGTIELSSRSGILGNEFTGQINISDDVNTENMYCKWLYEEKDIALWTDSSSLNEKCTFKVIGTESKSTYIAAQIYREDVCLGTLENAEYTISAIDAEKIIDKFTVGIADHMEIDLMGSGKCVIGGELDFSTKLNMSYIKSLDCEVEKVIVTYASSTETMEQDAEGQYSKRINVRQSADAEAMPKITVVFNSGIEVSVSSRKTLKLDNEVPIVNVSLVDGEHVVKKEWLSQNDKFENLKLKIDVSDTSTISKCKVTSSDAAGGHRVNKIDGSYYVDINLKEQITDYVITVEDERGNCTEIIYTVKIDNTKPSKEVKVLFSGNQEIISEEEIENGYCLGEGQGTVYSNGHIIMNLEVADDTETSDISSGINKVIVTVLVTTIDGEKEQSYVLCCNGNSKDVVSFCVNKDQSDPEMNYQIKQVYIEDYAGNSVELSGENGCADAVMYAVDSRLPVIEYSYADGIIDPEMEDTIYYGETVTGIVEVSDLNLNQYQLSVVNAENYHMAEIKEDMISDIKATYSLALNEDGKYQIYTKADPILGNWFGMDSVEQSSATMIVDTIAPVIEVKLFAEGGAELTNYANQYYRENINAQISVKEQNLDTAEVKIYCNGELQILYTQDDFIESLEEEMHRLASSLTEEGEYYLEVSCKDKTGKEAVFQSDKFIIDKTAPKVTITYDNNEARHEFYYNAGRTATIQVEDAALNKDTIELKIESVQGNDPVLSDWTEAAEGAEKIFTAKVNFSQDDIYDVSFACEDLAGNRSEECDGGHFVIDRTSPIVRIEYDNYSGQNEFYYREDRTAFITVEDLSFDKDSFVVTNADGKDAVPVSSSGSWSGSDTYHVTEIMCNEEGAYQFSIYTEDLAGNEAVTESSEYFIIDKTAPEIEITGITHESANQGDVVPVISYKDKYLDDDNSNILLTGYKNGVVSVNTTISSDEISRSIQYDAFPKIKEMDDVYTLTVHIEDKAGNQSEEEYLFSVNRFGSTFNIDKATAELLEKYYTNEEQDIVITEVNVDNLKQEEITISFNGEPRTLKKGTDYKITSQGSSATWKSYTYTIFKSNFEKEGQYMVSVFSKDTANNQSDNNVQDLEITFAVDKSAPSIVVTDLEDNSTYSQSELVFNMDIKDNMCLEGANLLINGKEVQSYGQEELVNVVSYKLTESDKPIDITIRATDIVGNINEKTFNNILLNQNKTIIEEEEIALSNSLQADQIDKASTQINVLRFGIIAMPVAAVLLIISAIALQKKKEQEKP